MATATEAPASTTAEGPTQHTQNQASRFTTPQLRLLHRAVDPKRIGSDDKGFSHMEAWDIKRYLIRVFGFAGYDTENRELTLVREIEIPAGNKSRWTVVYRAQVRLTVKDVQGRELAHWDGEAAGRALGGIAVDGDAPALRLGHAVVAAAGVGLARGGRFGRHRARGAFDEVQRSLPEEAGRTSSAPVPTPEARTG